MIFHNQGPMWSWSTPEDVFNGLWCNNKKGYNGNKNSTKKVILKNTKTGQEIEFNSSKDADEYVVKTLGFTKREKEASRKNEIKGWIRV